MRIKINPEDHIYEEQTLMISEFVARHELPVKSIVLAVNGEIMPHSAWERVSLKDGDEVEIVRAVAGGDHDSLEIAGHEFSSRLFLGTGKYPDNASMADRSKFPVQRW